MWDFRVSKYLKQYYLSSLICFYRSMWFLNWIRYKLWFSYSISAETKFVSDLSAGYNHNCLFFPLGSNLYVGHCSASWSLIIRMCLKRLSLIIWRLGEWVCQFRLVPRCFRNRFSYPPRISSWRLRVVWTIPTVDSLWLMIHYPCEKWCSWTEWHDYHPILEIGRKRVQISVSTIQCVLWSSFYSWGFHEGRVIIPWAHSRFVQAKESVQV